jgi:hypothetical protein
LLLIGLFDFFEEEDEADEDPKPKIQLAVASTDRRLKSIGEY